MREILLQILMWIVTICTYISYIPQIYKLIKSKTSEDLSVYSWILWMVTAVADSTYSIILGRFELIIASLSELVLILTTMILTIKFRKRGLNYDKRAGSFNQNH